jgi:hypothetical protein
MSRDVDQLEQWLAQGVVLIYGTTLSVRSRRTPDAPSRSHRGTGLMAPPRMSKRNAQASLGRAVASAKHRNHLGGSDRAVPCPRSRAAPEASASPLRHDDRQGPYAGTVTTPEPPSLLEVQHRVAQAIWRSTYSWPPSRMLPMLPNAGTEISKLSVFLASFIHPLSWG